MFGYLQAVWPVLAGNPLQTDQNKVPKGPGRRPEQFGTGLWSVRSGLAAKTGRGSSGRAPEALLAHLQYRRADLSTGKPLKTL